MVANTETEECLRAMLSAEGFTLNRPRAHGETGVDILATRDHEAYHIEVIGFKQSPSVRAKDFYEGFFRTVSRLNDGAEHCVLAMPKRFENGLPARAGQHRVAWGRIASAFPELEIWLVDTESCTYHRRSWGEWAS